MAATRSYAAADRRYRTQEDVRTLAEARRIEADTKRLRAAKVEAKRMLEEQQKKQDDLSAIAKGEDE